MKPENKQFLDDNRHHHFTLVNAQYLKGLNGHEREGMQRVMSEEFQPGYTADLWCPPCCADMVLQLYRRYDEWLDREAGKELTKFYQEVEAVEGITEEPAPDGPLIVQATFPAHTTELSGVDAAQVKPSDPQLVKENQPAANKNHRRK